MIAIPGALAETLVAMEDVVIDGVRTWELLKPAGLLFREGDVGFGGLTGSAK